MDAIIKEISAILRSTDQMAIQFAERVETRVGQPVSYTETLSAMQKISTRNLTLEKVVAKIHQQRKLANRRTTRRTPRQSADPAVAQTSPATDSPSTGQTIIKSVGAANKKPGTILARLDVVLQKNWDRAESEGLQPDRMSSEAFIDAVYQYTDRREATRQRILRAAKQLDQADVALTPALVADTAHKLFEG